MILIKGSTYIPSEEYKYVDIGDKVYMIALKVMTESQIFKSQTVRPLKLTTEYVESLPEQGRSIDHVTEEFVQKNPVIMFESPVTDDRYFRWDGRHRIFGYWRMGLTEIPAVWLKRDIWGRFICAFRAELLSGVMTPELIGKMTPMVWDRSPIADPSHPPFHYEYNFSLPEPSFTWSDLDKPLFK